MRFSSPFSLREKCKTTYIKTVTNNLIGTKRIIDACVECGVQRLVLCSSVDVVIGFDDIKNGSEQTTEKPDKFLFPGYPETKYMQECIVLQANGKQTVDSKYAKTCLCRFNHNFLISAISNIYCTLLLSLPRWLSW